MNKTKMMLLGSLLLASVNVAVAAPVPTETFAVHDFIADFTKFNIGDTVPQLYRTDEYNIKDWKIRCLPAPAAGSHWTYMGGNYVLITDAEGKILKAYDGKIFYNR